MSEKRHETKKFANYQNVIVRNSPALGRHIFVSTQNLKSMAFVDIMHMISTQLRWQDPC